jgi:hypothetical protein
MAGCAACGPSTRADGDASEVESSRLMDCPEWDPNCDAGSGGGVETAAITVVVTNDDTSPRVIDAFYVLRSPAGIEYGKTYFLSGTVFQPGEQRPVTVNVTVGDGFYVSVKGAATGSPSLWNRYDHDAPQVGSGSFTCSLSYRLMGGGGYGGCP